MCPLVFLADRSRLAFLNLYKPCLVSTLASYLLHSFVWVSFQWQYAGLFNRTPKPLLGRCNGRLAGFKAKVMAFWCSFSLMSLSCYADPQFGGSLHAFNQGDPVFVEIKSFASLEDFPLRYYSLPFCLPPVWSYRNWGEVLIDGEIIDSAYRFKVNVNESVHLCTSGPLTIHEVRFLKEKVGSQYQVNLVLDNLPVTTLAWQRPLGIGWRGYKGYPLGFQDISGESYIMNHLKFRVLLHEQEGDAESKSNREGKFKFPNYTIVGFEVIPSSVKRDMEPMLNLKMYDAIEIPIESLKGQETSQPQVIKEMERVSYTYEVEFVKSEIGWHSRSDVYLKVAGAEKVFWSWIPNSVMTISLAFFMFFWLIRKELTKRPELVLPQDQYQEREELSGWQAVIGDVFREPTFAKLLCVMVGNGIQITGTAIVFKAFVLLLPADSRGMIFIITIYVYTLFGIVAGYSSVRIWRIIKPSSEGWKSISCAISCFFPGIVILIHSLVGFTLARDTGTGTIPMPLTAGILLLWFSIAVPLTMLGGFLGTKIGPIRFPVKTRRIPRHIPRRKCATWLLLFGSGILPFAALNIGFMYFLSDGWQGAMSFHLELVFEMFIPICVAVSVGVTFLSLQSEDWGWWWKSFIASGSSAVYAFLHTIKYMFVDLPNLNIATSVSAYIGYSLITAIAIMLCAGAIGFLSSLHFVFKMYVRDQNWISNTVKYICGLLSTLTQKYSKGLQRNVCSMR